MDFHVNFQPTSPGILFVTNRANVRPLTSMRELVCLQMTLGDEALITVVTGEGPLA